MLQQSTITYGKNIKLECDTVLKQLKYALLHALILAIPDYNANHIVETYSSDIAVGTALIQYNLSVSFILKGLNSEQ